MRCSPPVHDERLGPNAVRPGTVESSLVQSASWNETSPQGDYWHRHSRRPEVCGTQLATTRNDDWAKVTHRAVPNRRILVHR